LLIIGSGSYQAEIVSGLPTSALLDRLRLPIWYMACPSGDQTLPC